MTTDTVQPGETVALVTDDTPSYLEFGQYRGWVLLDRSGSWLGDLTDADVAALSVQWDEVTNGEYARQGTIR